MNYEKYQNTIEKLEKINKYKMSISVNEVSNAYRKALSEVEDKIKRYLSKQSLTSNDIFVIDSLNKLKNDITSIIAELNNEVNTITKDNIISTYIYNFNTNLNVIKKYIIDFTFTRTIDEKSVLDIMTRQYNFKTINTFNNAELMSKIKTELSNAVIVGKSINDTSNSIKQVFNISKNKAVRIARTELHRSANVSRLESFNTVSDVLEETKNENFKKLIAVKVWHSVNDSRTREDHAEMDNVEANENGIFVLPDGTECESPGTTGLPEHDINCRCSFTIEFKEKEE